MKTGKKRFLAILLIVAMTVTNTGFSVLAESIDSVITETKENMEETPNYYLEMEYERQTIVEEYQEYLENENPDISDEGGDELFDEEGDRLFDAEKDEIDEPEESEELEEAEEPEEDVEPEEDEPLNESSFDEISDDVLDATDEANIDEEETSEKSSDESFDDEIAKEEIASESIAEEENEDTPLNIDEEEIASESEVEEEKEEKKASESEVEEVVLEEIASESETREVDEDEIASESETEEIFNEATISEVEYATESEIATKSEIASESEIATASDIIIATISKTIWKVKKIYINDVSRTQAMSRESEEEIMARLATCANVELINNRNEEKLININLTWKLYKEIKVNAEGGVHANAIPVEVLRKKYNVDEIIRTGSASEIISTKNETEFVENVKKIANELGKEVVVVTATDSLITDEETKEVEEITDEVIEIADEEKNDEEKIEENVSTKSEVFAFSETEISSDSEIKEEIDDIDNKSTSSEIASDSELKEENGIIDPYMIRDKLQKYADLKTIYLYKLDEAVIAEEIINAINRLNEEEKALLNDELKKDEKEEKGFFETLLDILGFKSFTVSDEPETKENTLEDLLKQNNIDVLNSFNSSPFDEIDVLSFGADDHNPDHTMYVTTLPSPYTKITKTDNFSFSGAKTSLEFIYGDASNPKDLDKEPGELTDGVNGSMYLVADLTIRNTWRITTASFLTICTNGHSLTFATAGNIIGDGTLNICNCKSGVSHIHTQLYPQYNWHDQYFATTNETYTKYNEKPLFNVSILNVIAHTKNNIVFDNSTIKNVYNGKLAVTKMVDRTEDFPEISGGGSLMTATQKLQMYGVTFTNNKAIRTNGVAINSQLATLILEGSTFKDNHNLSNRGGAIAFNPDATYIYDCTFENNTAETLGGALYGRVYSNKPISHDGGTQIEKTTFKDNKALKEGGAIFLDYVTKVSIKGEASKKTFEKNYAGVAGGAIAINHFKANDTKENIPWDNKPSSTEKKAINLDTVSFEQNEAHALKRNASNEIVEDTGSSSTHLNQNFGGAIYVNNRPNDNQTSDEATILDEMNIKNTTFTKNLAKGELLDIATAGIASEKYYFNNYGGAMYIKGVGAVNVEETTFEENYSLTGGAMCLSENTKLNMISGTIKGCSAYDDTHNTKSIDARFVSPGGGAIYLMNASASIAKDVKILNNINAIYLAQGTLDIGAEEVKENKGEYLIGFTNNLPNKILFSGVDIRDHVFNGGSKDYTKENPHMSSKSTTISFKNTNTITNNKEIPTGLTAADAIICNLNMKSSVSNIQLDLKDYSFGVRKKGKIGLHYDLDCSEILAPGGGHYDPIKYVDDELTVFNKWNEHDSKVFAERAIWTNLFTLDNAESDPLAKNWKFYAKDGDIKVSPYIFTVKFDTFFTDDEIEPQFYNYKLGSNEEIKITTPTELLSDDGSARKYTIIGFMGLDKASDSVPAGRPKPDPNKWVMWNFDDSRMKAEYGVTEGVLITVYTDNSIKVKACGCPSGTLCNHENGVQHEDRGTALSTSSDVKFRNYIAVATPVHLGYAYNDGTNKYKTQYVLEKDLFINQKDASEFLRGDMVINLNSHTLEYDTSVSDDELILTSDTEKQNYFEEEDAGIFICGVASAANVTRGKIKATDGKHKKSFIDAGDGGVFISKVDIENINNETENNTDFIKRTKEEKNEKQYVTFEDVKLNNIKLKSNFISSSSKVILKKVNIDGNVSLLENNNLALIKGRLYGINSSFKLIDSNVSNVDSMGAIYRSAVSNPVPIDIVIASSTIIGNKFEDAMLNTSGVVPGSTISFIGKNTVKNNTITSGKYLFEASHNGNPTEPPVRVIFGDNNSKNEFTENTVQDVDKNAIIHITKKSSVSFIGINRFTGNKSTAKTTITSTVYQDAGSQVELSDTALNVTNNNTKYNWYIENSDLPKMITASGKKFTASSSTVAIRVQDITKEEALYDEWNDNTVVGGALAEKTFIQDPTYQSEAGTYKKAAAYKWTMDGSTKRSIYFGREYATGTFKIYNYQQGVDERTVNGGNNYDHELSAELTQRVKINKLTDLDKPIVSPPNPGDKIMWEGLKYGDDVSKEEFYGFDINDLKIKTEDDFEITGYIAREKHQHDGDIRLPVEVRNEGHFQATESIAFLHNDVTITRPLTKLTGDFILCLNGHKLTIAKDINWLDVVGSGRKVIIYNCPFNDPATITSSEGLSFSTTSIVVGNGVDFKLSNVKIDNIKSTTSIIKVLDGAASAEVDRLTINGSTIDFSKKTTKEEFVSIAESVNATYSDLTFTNNTLKTYPSSLLTDFPGKEQSLMALRKIAPGDFAMPKIDIEENNVEGRGNVLRVYANTGDINIGDGKLVVKKNKTNNSTPIYFFSTNLGANTNSINMKNPTFEGNMKTPFGTTDVEAQAATFGLDDQYEFKTLNIDGGTFKDNGLDAAGVSGLKAYSTLKLENIEECNIKNVDFVNDNNNTTPNAEGYAILINKKNTKTVFDHCNFTGGSSAVNGYMNIEKNAKDVLFINGTKFENIKAANVIKISDREAAATTLFEDVTFSACQADNMIMMAGDATTENSLIASNSIMTGNKATEILLNNAKTDVLLQNFTIENAGDTLPGHKGINVINVNSITINEKIVIKGHKENLSIKSGVKLTVGTGHKLLDGSVIYMTIPNGNSDPDFKFFEQWNPTYIEKYGYHKDTKIAYLPSDIFKYDASLTTNVIYRSDENDLYAATSHSNEYATLEYVDHDIQPQTAPLLKQYVKLNVTTKVDRVHVWYLSTSSQVWMATVLPGDRQETWKVLDDHTVNLPTKKAYQIILTKKHIHKICGLDAIIPCQPHSDGSMANHTEEMDFYPINSDIELIKTIASVNDLPAGDEKKHYYFGLNANVNLTQTSLNELNGKDHVAFCLQGHVLTLDVDATILNTKSLTITNCEAGGHITVKNGNTSKPLVETHEALNLYNVTFKGFTTTTSVVSLQCSNDKMRVENVKFDTIVSKDNVNGLFGFGTGDKAFIKNLTFEGNTSKGDSTIFNTGAAGIVNYDSDTNGRINNIVFNNNKYEQKLIKFGPGNVKLDTMIIKDNKLISSATTEAYGALYVDGNTEFTDDVEFVGNDTTALADAKGGAVYVSSGKTLKFAKKVVYDGNKSNRGAGAYISGTMIADTEATFMNNDGKDGVAIYKESAGQCTLPSEVIFDNNKGKSVIAYAGSLTLDSPIFKNHTTACENIVVTTEQNSNIIVGTPTFIRNNVTGSAFKFDKTSSASIKNVTIQTNNNKFGRFVELTNGANFEFADSIFKGNTFSDSVIKISTPGNVVFNNVTMSNNNVTNAAVILEHGKLEVKGKVVVDGNPTASGTKDILISDADSYVTATSRLSEETKLAFYPYKAGARVFDSWNATVFEKYGTQSTLYSDSRKYAYTPENSGMLLMSGKAISEGYNIYKKGTSATDTQNIYAGKENVDYVKVTFVYEEETPYMTYVSQNIAKDVSTKLEKIDAHDVPLNKQVWIGSASGTTETWCWGTTPYTVVNASVSVTEKVHYQKPHLHGGTDEYYPITNARDFEGNLNPYLVLKADIDIKGKLNINSSVLKGICLNGHKITIRGNLASESEAMITLINDFTICDCLGKGKIVMRPNEYRYGDIIKVNAAGKTVDISVPFEDIRLKSTGSDTSNIIDVVDGTVNYTYATISKTTLEKRPGDVTIAPAEGVFNVSGGSLNITDLLLEENDATNDALLTINDKTHITGNLTVKGNTMGLYDLVVNSNTADTLDNVVIEDNKTSTNITTVTTNPAFLKYTDTTSTYNIAGDLIAKNNKYSLANTVSGKRMNAVELYGALHVAGDATFEGNDSNGRIGAALLVQSDASTSHGAIDVSGKTVFKNNTGRDQVAISANVDDATNIKFEGGVVFDGNKAVKVSSITDDLHNAIIGANNIYVDNAVFKNHSGASELIAAIDDGSIKISSVSFIDNNLTAEAIKIGGTYTSELEVNGVTAENSKFTKFIDTVGKLVIKDTDLSDIDCSDVLVSIDKTEDGVGTIIENSIINNKNTSKPSLNVLATYTDPASMSVVGLKGDVNIGKTILNDKSYFTARGMIASTSTINISSIPYDGYIVFDSWNQSSIERFDNPDIKMTDTRKYVYTPENSGLFINSGNASYKFYKEGTTSVTVNLGTKFAVATFRYNPADPEDADLAAVYCTQNISKNVPTRLDKVDMIDYEMHQQEWMEPIEPTGEIRTAFNPVMIATYNIAHDIKLVEKHIHKICGTRRSIECSHDNGEVHTSGIVYEEITTASDLMTYSYVALKKDIVVSDTSMNLSYYSTLKGICLNGHTITFTKAMGYTSSEYPLITLGSNELAICDCKYHKEKHGAIKTNITNVTEGTFHGSLFRVNSGGKLNIYNTYLDHIIIKEDAAVNDNNKGSIIKVTNGGHAYIDNVTIINTDETTTKGALQVADGADMKIRNLTITKCDMTKAYAFLTLNNNMDISTISIIGNKPNAGGIYPFIKVDGNDVKAKKIFLENNITSNQMEGFIYIPSGAKLTVDEDTLIKGNRTGRNGIIYVEGELYAKKNIDFIENISELNAAGLYVKGNGKVKVDGKASFVKNRSGLDVNNKAGTAIQGENITENAFDFNEVEFDNNEAGFNYSINGGVVEWSGTLKLDNAVFKNHSKENTSLIMSNGSGAKLILNNPVFENNNLVRDAIVLYNTNAASKISGIDSKSTGNKANNFITVSGGKVSIEDNDIKGITCQDSVINVKAGAVATISSISITANKTVNGGLKVDDGTVAIKGKVIVNDNTAISGAAKDVYINSALAKIKAAGLVDMDSRLSISAYDADVVAFEDWNSTAFAKYDNPDINVEKEYMFTPENCGVFLVGKASEGQKFYTSGNSEANNKVMLGNNYVVLSFKNPAGDAIEPFFGTQNIEKGVETKVNKVDSFEYELIHQEWKFPAADETSLIVKSFSTGDIKVNYTNSHDINYIQKHFHKDCGLNVHKPCEHDGITSHGPSVEWFEATNQEQLESTTHDRWFLTTDLEISGAINLPNTIKGVCLNGHKIVQTVNGSPIFNVPAGAAEVTICNCKEKGGLTTKEGLTSRVNLIKTSSPDFRLMNVDIYGVTSDAMYVNVAAGNAYLEDVTIKGNKAVGSDGFITGEGTMKLVRTTFDGNNTINANPLLKINTNMTLATTSVINNVLKGLAIDVVGDAVLDKELTLSNNTTTNTQGLFRVEPGITLDIKKQLTAYKNKVTNGGVFDIANTAKLIFDGKVTFDSNEATNDGAGIYVEEGGFLTTNDDITFTNNKAKSGSAIYIEDGGTSGTPKVNINAKSVFDKETNSVGGAVTFGGYLKLSDVSFKNNTTANKAFITNINKSASTDKLVLENIDVHGNGLDNNVAVAGKNGFNLAGVDLEVDKLNVYKDANDVKTNNLDNLFLLDNVHAVIKNSTVSNATLNGSAFALKNGSEIDFYNSVIEKNTAKGSMIDLVSSIARNQTAFDIKDNTTTGNKGSAITIDVNSKYEAVSGKLTISGNKADSGSAVQLEGKLAIDDDEIIIYNNKTSGKNKNVYLANANARIMLMTASSKINQKTKIGITSKDDNQVFFDNWKNGIVQRYETVYADSPESIFVADDVALSNKFNTYKSGIEGSTVLKFGKNYVTLTFQNANKTIIYSKQNIEKSKDTTLDTVKISNVADEKWIVPGDKTSDADATLQFINPVDANYSVSKNIVKSFKYKVLYTAGTKEGIVTGDMGGAVEYEYGDPITIKPSVYEGAGVAFTKWSLRSAAAGVKADFMPYEITKNICDVEDGIAYLDARWEGEYLVRFYPNGEYMDIGLAYDANYNKIVTKGTKVTLNMTYPSSLIVDTERFKPYTKYNTKSDGSGSSYNVNQVITVNGDISLYCLWIDTQLPPPPPPKPVDPPKNSGSSGGGGGGGGSGFHSNGMWINGVWIPVEFGPLMPQGYRMDEFGNIVDPNGNIAGSVSQGDKLNADGTYTDAYGNTHNINGSITTADGMTYNLDGSITDPYGVTYLVDGSITYPGGVNLDANGMLHRADGAIVAPDGTIYYPNGNVEYPDGTVVLVNGEIQKAQANAGGDAKLEYDPTTGNWKFFTLNTDTGAKTYYKEKWVSAANRVGKKVWYLTDISGNMVTGWAKMDNEFYYLSDNIETLGEAVLGNVTLNGVTYNFDPTTGALLSGDIPKDFTVVGAINHKSGIDGTWETDRYGNKKFFIPWFDAEGNLIKVPVSGWYMIDGYYYFFGEENEAKTGLVLSDGKYYYMKNDGRLLEGGQIEIEGVIFTFDKATGACRSVINV